MREPGQHEKDVDAHVAAGQPRNAGVERHDEQNRDAPQAFDVGSESAGLRGHA